MKAYHTKKFKIEHANMLKEGKHQQQEMNKTFFNKTQKQKFSRDLSVLTAKEQEEKKLENLRYHLEGER